MTRTEAIDSAVRCEYQTVMVAAMIGRCDAEKRAWLQMSMEIGTAPASFYANIKRAFRRIAETERIIP